MTTLPKHLEEMRQFSLHEEGVWYGTEELPPAHKECKFVVIERAAIDVMLKDMEIMAKALEFVTMPITSESPTVEGLLETMENDRVRAIEELKNYREKYMEAKDDR